jgi:GPH family glycoside/pentoside/hexuronide:cation symporter
MKKWKASDTLILSVIWAALLIAAVIVLLYFKGFSPKLDDILRMASTQPPVAEASDTDEEAFDFIAFDPNVLDGQKPGVAVPRAQIERLVDGAARYAAGIRTYGMSDGLDDAIEYAHGKGMRTIAGIWLSSDPAANELEMERAGALAATGAADILCVGNECLLRGDLSEEELLGYIARARELAGAGTLVAYADTPVNFSDELLMAIDVALPNIHPYWAGILPQEGVSYVNDEVGALAARAAAVNPDLAIIVGETGYPNTVPGWEQFWAEYLSSGDVAPTVAFMLADCPWKAEDGNEIEGHWGILDVSDDFTLVPKSEIDAVLGRVMQ